MSNLLATENNDESYIWHCSSKTPTNLLVSSWLDQVFFILQETEISCHREETYFLGLNLPFLSAEAQQAVLPGNLQNTLSKAIQSQIT